MINKYEIEESVLLATLNYLAKKPYEEVAVLIQKLQTLPKIIQSKEDVTKKE